MPSFDQSSFLGGQESSRNWGTKLENENRLELSLNSISDIEGSISRRPGTQEVLHGETSLDQDGNSLEGQSWSLKGAGEIATTGSFRYSNADQYVFVFKDMKYDVVQNGQVIRRDLDSPWPKEDLLFDPADDSKPGLKFNQEGDFLVVTHPNHLPRQIERVSDDEWRIGFVNETRKGTTGRNLQASIEGGAENDPEFEFRFMAVGLGKDDRWLSEITADEANIQSVSLVDGVINVRLQEDLTVQVGDRVILRNLQGTTELNDNSYRIVSVEDTMANSDTECISTGVHTSTSEANARASAKAELDRRGYPNNQSFRVSRRSGDTSGTREETRNVVARFVFLATSRASLPSQVTVAQLEAALRASGNIRSGESITLPNSPTDITSGITQFNSIVPSSIGRTYPVGHQWSIGYERSQSIALNSFTVPSSGGIHTRRFTVRITLSRTVTTTIQGRTTFQVVGRGCKNISRVARGYRTIGLETNLGSLNPHTAGTGIMTTFIKTITGKRRARITLTWEDVSPDVEWIAVYQAAEAGFGLAGATDGPETSIELQGVASDLTSTPPLFRNPFETSNPQCSGTFHQRRVYGGFGTREPNTMKFSRTAFVDQFDASVRIQDNDAFDTILDATEVNDIRHMIRLRDTLFILTGGGMWSVYSPGAFTPYTASTRQEQSYGSTHLKPLILGSTMLHVGDTGDTVYQTGLNTATDRHVTGEIANKFSEILEQDQIISWDYKEGSSSLVIGVLESGEMVFINYSNTRQMVAASKWKFGGGWQAREVVMENVREGNQLHQVAVFLVHKDDEYRLWKMDFSPGSLSRRFPADGVLMKSSTGENIQGDDQWIHYRQGDTDRVENVQSGFRFQGDRPAFHQGFSYPFLLRSMRQWGFDFYAFQEAQVRLLEGSEVKVRNVPMGEYSLLEDDESSDDLSGSYRVILGPGQGRVSRAPQLEILQNKPSPLTLIGFTAEATRE